MDDSCWGTVGNTVIRACNAASLECWTEVQAKEFLHYKRNKIRHDIIKRKQARLKKLMHADRIPVPAQAEPTDTAAAADLTADKTTYTNPIIIIDESDTEENLSSPSAPTHVKRRRAIKVQQTTRKQPPTASAPSHRVSTLERLLHKIQNDQNPVVLDPPECQHESCPFCKGSLMCQRYYLARRLVQIEHAIYGEHAEIRLP